MSGYLSFSVSEKVLLFQHKLDQLPVFISSNFSTSNYKEMYNISMDIDGMILNQNKYTLRCILQVTNKSVSSSSFIISYRFKLAPPFVVVMLSLWFQNGAWDSSNVLLYRTQNSLYNVQFVLFFFQNLTKQFQKALIFVEQECHSRLVVSRLLPSP